MVVELKGNDTILGTGGESPLSQNFQNMAENVRVTDQLMAFPPAQNESVTPNAKVSLMTTISKPIGIPDTRAIDSPIQPYVKKNKKRTMSVNAKLNHFPS